MNLNILEQTYTFDNTQEGLQQLINRINEELNNKKVFFSHMIINGEEIFEDQEEYILENIERVNNITVVVKTIEQLVSDLLISLHTYTARAIPVIKELVDQMYQKPQSESWDLLVQLIDGMKWVYETVKSIDNTDNKESQFVVVTATFEAELPNLMEAMESQDAILIADIIQYEILPQFEYIHSLAEGMFEEITD